MLPSNNFSLFRYVVVVGVADPQDESSLDRAKQVVLGLLALPQSDETSAQTNLTMLLDVVEQDCVVQWMLSEPSQWLQYAFTPGV